MNLFCNKCGSRLSDGAIFCSECGAAVPNAFSAASPPEPTESVDSILAGLKSSKSEPNQTSLEQASLEQTSLEQSGSEQANLEQTSLVQSQSEKSEPTKPEGVFPEPEIFSVQPPNAVDSQPVIPAPQADSAPHTDSVTPVSVEITKVPENQNSESKTRAYKPQQSTGGKVVTAILSVLLSIILFLTVTAGQSWFIVRNSIDGRVIQTAARAVIDDIDIAAIPVDDFIEACSVNIPGYEAGGDSDLSEAIFSSINKHYIEEYGIEQDMVAEALNNKALNDFIGDIAEEGIQYILVGDNSKSPIVTPDEVIKLIKKNSDEIEEVTDYAFDDDDYDRIRRSLEKSGFDKKLTWGSVFSDTDAPLPGPVSEVREILDVFNRLSTVVIVVLAITAAAVIALIAILNRRRLSNTLVYFGIPCIISGGSCVLIGFFTDTISGKIAEMMDMSSVNVVQTFFAESGKMIYMTGAIVLAAGVLSIVVKIITAQVRNNER